MKFIVTGTELLKHLQTISGVLSTNNTLAILDNFLFEVDGDTLTVSASDLETTMNTRLGVKAQEKGAIAVPARTLLDYLKTLPEQPLTFTIDEKTRAIEIASSFGKIKMAGFPNDEFPRNPEMEDASTVTMTAEVLAEAIGHTIFAAGNDDMKPVLSGVFCEFSEEHLRFVATDAHKLVRYTRLDQSTDRHASFIVPKKPLTQLKNILANTSSDVRVSFNEKHLRFEFDDNVLIGRLIDGQYPNYEAVIPKDNPNRMLVERKALLNSIRRVSIFSNKTTHQVRLHIQGSELSLSAEDLDFANEANERLTCSYTGEDMEIGFNSRFIIEMLNNLVCENVEFHLSGSNRAGILVPVHEDEVEDSKEDLLMLVMPVMLNE